jgi:hypothetical protein
MQQFRRLIGFKFKRHPGLNPPDWRLEAIENHLQKRINMRRPFIIASLPSLLFIQ